MKKLIILLLVASLCISLAACGGTGNPDHDYVLSLMYNADILMADMEIMEPLSETALAAINDSLKQA